MTGQKTALENKQLEENKMEQTQERHKMTIYIDKAVAKKFKKLAIDLEKDYSQLSEIAFTELIKKHQEDNSSTG